MEGFEGDQPEGIRSKVEETPGNKRGNNQVLPVSQQELNTMDRRDQAGEMAVFLYPRIQEIAGGIKNLMEDRPGQTDSDKRINTGRLAQLKAEQAVLETIVIEGATRSEVMRGYLAKGNTQAADRLMEQQRLQTSDNLTPQQKLEWMDKRIAAMSSSSRPEQEISAMERIKAKVVNRSVKF